MTATAPHGIHQLDVAALGDGDYNVHVEDGIASLELAAGGGGAGWDHVLSLPLSTLTGWTAGAGAWSITGGVIRQSTTPAAVYRLRYTAARLALAESVVQVETRLNSASGVSSRTGVVFGAGFTSDVNGGFLAAAIVNAGVTLLSGANWEYDAILAGPVVALPSNIAFGTWFTLRAHKSGNDVNIYADGVLVGTGHIDQANREQGTLALYAYGGQAEFRNLDVWAAAQP